MDQRRNTDHDSSRRTSRRVTRRRTSDRPATDQRRGIGDQRCTTRRMIRPSDGRAMHDQTDDQTIRRTSNARPEQMDQRRTNDTLTHDSTKPATDEQTDEQTDKQTEQRRTGSRDDQWQSNRQTSGRKDEETDKRCMSSRSTTMVNDARTADQPRMSKPATMTPVDRAATEQRRANGYNRSGQTSDRPVIDE